MNSDRAIYINSSNAGIFPVVLFVVPVEGGLELNIESSDSYRPRVKIPLDCVKGVGKQFERCGLHKQTITWKAGLFTRIWIRVKPVNEGVVSCTFFGTRLFLLSFVGFKIETEKVRNLGEVLCGYETSHT
ncbi:MAG: hypothetical protein GY694_12740 [Gammaproteobacteria bacterium]|nr:hypothetical protein [Gammaproteobacteria bacterium]